MSHYNRGGFQQPMSGSFQGAPMGGFQGMGGMQSYGGFQNRGAMMGNMRGGSMGMRGGRGGMGANGMMGVPLGGMMGGMAGMSMGMPQMGAGMGMQGMSTPQLFLPKNALSFLLALGRSLHSVVTSSPKRSLPVHYVFGISIGYFTDAFG